MSIYAVVRETLRITDPAIEKHVRTPLAYSEGLAHFFGAAILNAAGTGNEPLSGYTVTAHFIRGDNYYGTITGAVDGNVAYVILPSWCYRAKGPFTLTVYLNSGSGSSATTRCVMIVKGRTMLDTTDSMIDPEHIIPSINELLAQFAACAAATAAANAAALNADAKAAAANTAAANANDKAAAADTAATGANSAASAASAAAVKINDMTVDGHNVLPGAGGSATLSLVNGHYHIAFGLEKGEKGDDGVVGNIGNDQFAFSIDSNGHLILYYNSVTPPDFAINSSGHLIYTF